MTGLAAFLIARFDEDEAIAIACTSRDWVAYDATVRGGPWVGTAGPGPRMSRFVGEPFPDRVASLLSPGGPPDAEFWTMVNLHGTTGKFETERRNAEHIARWDPTRALAEIRAKRLTLVAHQTGIDRHYQCQNADHIQEWQCERGDCPAEETRYCEICPSWDEPCRGIRILAVPYAGQEGWLEAWALDA